MDYIDSLLIMEDDLDKDEDLGELGHTMTESINEKTLTDSGPTTQESCNPQNPDLEDDPMVGGMVDWCVWQMSSYATGN